MNRAELLALPVVVDLPTAGRAIGLSRSHAYELHRRGEFPIPVQRLGSRYRVVTEALLAYLGLATPRTESDPAPSMRTDGPASPSAATADVSGGRRHDSGYDGYL